MKKLLSLLLVLCIAVVAVPVFAEDVVEADATDNWWSLDSFWIEVNDGTYTIVGLNGTGETVITLPSVLRGFMYNKNSEREYLSFEKYTIAPEAFKSCAGVTKIVFENELEVIPRGLCENMPDLEVVVLPKSVYAIDNDAFKECEKLKTIDLSRVEHIGRSAFEGCKSLESIALSAKIESIEGYTFYGCESLENVAGLHSGISIGQDAFTGTKVDLNNIDEEAPTVADEEDYIYPAKDAFKNQEQIVELTADALSWFPKEDDPESEKYDFTTDDAVTIKKIMDVLNSCRYREVKGVFASEGTAFLIKVKYSDGAEAQMVFKQSTVRIDEHNYRIMESDYWKLAGCLQDVKTVISVKERMFKDVAKNSEYAEAIEGLATLGIMGGYADNTFKPNDTLTRAEAAAIIVRLVKLEDEVEQGETMFCDVTKSHWASGYINEAVANGIINGQGDGTFAPEETVTYQQIVKMLICALGYEPVALANGGWKNGGYAYAAEKIELIESEAESKDEPITRGEAAELCYKALDTDFMEEIWVNCTGMGTSAYKILVGETILTEYWGMEVEFVREFYFEKVFGFKLPEGAKCVEGEYWVENNGDETCYMGKISFDKNDLEYIKENLEKQNFEDGVLSEDSDVLYDAKHHCDWWDVGKFGTQKDYYHRIKEEVTVRYIHAVEFEAAVVVDNDGTYWLYVYKLDVEDVNSK